MTKRDEFEREWRVLDQTISMQSRLRDIYHRRSIRLNLTAMLLAVAMASLAFAGDLSSESTVLGLNATQATWVGIGSCLVLFLTIFDLIVDWRGESFLRREAVARLADVKARYRSVHDDDENFETRSDEARELYHLVMPSIPPIPESMFNRLKAWHVRKVEVSKAIDRQPGRPLLLTRLDVILGRVDRE